MSQIQPLRRSFFELCGRSSSSHQRVVQNRCLQFVRCKTTKSGPSNKGSKIPAPDRPPRNKEIKHEIVRLVQNNVLQPPTQLSVLLKSLDDMNERARIAPDGSKVKYPTTHFLELVDAAQHPPVVKLFNAREVWKKGQDEKKRKAERGKTSGVSKEIVLRWNVDKADFERIMRKVREELEDRNSVDLALVPKQPQNPPSPRDIELRLQEVAAHLGEDVKERMPRTVQRGIGVLYLRAMDAVVAPKKPDMPPPKSERQLEKERKIEEQKLQQEAKAKEEKEKQRSSEPLVVRRW